MIFIDSNIPMYLVGAPHANKDRTLALLTKLIGDGERLVTSVEVYQEIIHRYMGLKRPDAIDPAFRTLDDVTDEVLSFGMPEVRAARELIRTGGGLSSRDALHVAVMRSAGTNRILSFDAGFDECPGIERLA